jgi:hypothetical protein
LPNSLYTTHGPSKQLSAQFFMWRFIKVVRQFTLHPRGFCRFTESHVLRDESTQQSFCPGSRVNLKCFHQLDLSIWTRQKVAHFRHIGDGWFKGQKVFEHFRGKVPNKGQGECAKMCLQQPAPVCLFDKFKDRSMVSFCEKRKLDPHLQPKKAQLVIEYALELNCFARLNNNAVRNILYAQLKCVHLQTIFKRYIEYYNILRFSFFISR